MFLSALHFVVNKGLLIFYNSVIDRLSFFLKKNLSCLYINLKFSSERLNFTIFLNLIFNCFFSWYFFILVWFYGFNVEIVLFIVTSFAFIIKLDWLSVSLLFLVSHISLIVHIYSLWYMNHDYYKDKFLMLLSCFTGSMLVLILGGNLLCIFIGWEMVGVSSFLLISFWETRKEALRAACKALFLNKIGDIFFFFAVVLLYQYTGSFNIETINMMSYSSFVVELYSFKIVDLLIIFLFIAAAAKSAQFGLHMWLIDAMEGPTPVSALIHAATMVTAGVFLLIRCNELFLYCSVLVLNFISFWGVLTAFVGGFLAIFQFDIKKIIAYSTMSQLGYMIAIVPFDCTLSLFHLVNHGWFKALLFLASGVVIHFCNNEQDIRRMKPLLVKQLPLTFLMFFFASFVMIALPLTSGFFSKDLIYELFFYNKIFVYYYNLLMLTGLFTVIYSLRLLYFVFFKKSVNFMSFAIKDDFFIISLVYLPLLFFTFLSGYIFVFFVKNSFFFLVDIKLILLNLLMIFFVFFYYFFFKEKFFFMLIANNSIFLFFYNFIVNRLFFDLFFNKIFYHLFVYVLWFFYSNFEMGWIYFLFGPSMLYLFRYCIVFGKFFESFNAFKSIILSFFLVIIFSIFF